MGARFCKHCSAKCSAKARFCNQCGQPFPKGVEIFFSYSHEDEALRKKLEKHLSMLQRQNLVTFWSDRDINAGGDWSKDIDQHLNSAEVILLLVSDDFMASNYCYGIEMKRAMERHESEEAIVIPIILRRVDWSEAPFQKLQALPREAKPIADWSNQDDAFYDMAKGIRRVIESNYIP